MDSERLAEIRAYAETGKPGHMNYDMVRKLLAHIDEMEASKGRLRRWIHARKETDRTSSAAYYAKQRMISGEVGPGYVDDLEYAAYEARNEFLAADQALQPGDLRDEEALCDTPS